MRGNHLESCLRTTCRAALVALATCSGLYATPAVAQKFTMKIGTATPRGDQNEWMKLFKQRVEKRGKGTISIQLYPSSQLGAIPRQIEGMQLGTVESWIGPPGFLKGVEPRWQVTDTPGLFRDKEHAQKTITDPAFRDVFLPLGEPKGVLGISIWASSNSSVVTRSRPIRRIEDFRGLKLRVLASDIEVLSLNRLSAAPTPLPLMETLPALQRGAIDGVKAALVIFVPFKYWTVGKYLTETHEAVFPSVAFVSKVWWDKLPGDLRSVMLDEAKTLEGEIYTWALAFNNGLRDAWLKGGGQIVDFPASERSKMMAKLATVGEVVVANKPAVKKIYDLLVQVSKKH